jgi:nitrogen-specific signal transduction histidine kinase
LPGKFIEVWREKEAALQSSNLTRLLLANSAHEVRTPLNAIINYLEIALEGTLDQETRENLARSHSASKSLIYVINDLLDLTKIEEGQSLIKDDMFELAACVEEATDPFSGDAKRKGIDYSVFKRPGLPKFVHGDARRIRQAYSNVTANAIAHTESGGSVKVEIYVSKVLERQVTVEFVVEDSGMGMSTQKLDELFQDLEQVSTEEPRLAPTSEQNDKPQNTRTLGLGLAVVSRTVRNMNGQLRLKSDEGRGSRFVVQLPFRLPDQSSGSEEESSHGGSQSTQQPNPVESAPGDVTAAPEGEILLVESNTERTLEDAKQMADQRSFSSRNSGGSLGSAGSQKSDADRLIHAIQTPMSLGEGQADYYKQSYSAKGSLTKVDAGSSIRSNSPTTLRSTRSASPTRPHDERGTADVRDSKTPIRPVKVPEEYQDMPSRPQYGEHSRVLFEIPNETKSKAGPESVTSGGTGEGTLEVLIAEDDPINMKILRKRLERTGHTVHHAVNGEDCATLYKEKPSNFDVILMDIQVSRRSPAIVKSNANIDLDAHCGRLDSHKDDSRV